MFGGIGGAYVAQGLNAGVRDFYDGQRQHVEDTRRRQREDYELARQQKLDKEGAIDRKRTRTRQDQTWGQEDWRFGREQVGATRADELYPMQRDVAVMGMADQMDAFGLAPAARRTELEGARLNNQGRALQNRAGAAEFQEWGMMAPTRQGLAKAQLDAALLRNDAGREELVDYRKTRPDRMKSSKAGARTATAQADLGEMEVGDVRRLQGLSRTMNGLDLALQDASETGRLDALTGWYNEMVPDGFTASAARTADGKIRVTLVDGEGKPAQSFAFDSLDQLAESAQRRVLATYGPPPQQRQGRVQTVQGQDGIYVIDPNNPRQAMPLMGPGGQPIMPRQQYGIGGMMMGPNGMPMTPGMGAPAGNPALDDVFAPAMSADPNASWFSEE